MKLLEEKKIGDIFQDTGYERTLNRSPGVQMKLHEN